MASLVQALQHPRHQLRRLRRLLVGVGDAQAPADVDVRDGNARRLDRFHQVEQAVQGEVPNPLNPPSGCTFHPRCPFANARCSNERPALITFKGVGMVQVACHAVEEGRI